MKRITTSILLALFVGCSSDDAAKTSQPIIGGTTDSGDPSVVLIGGGGVWCTGTLIAPRVVLTAAHCIGPKNSFVYFGPQYLGDAGGSVTSIAQSYPHPDYATNKNVDIGIVVLASASAVTPIELNTTALGPSDVNANVHVVGCGDTSNPTEPLFTKMQIDVPISSVTADAFMTGPAICSGDSGGPAMLTVNAKQVVAGVVSGHSIQACGGTAGYVRVDLYAQWLQQQIALADVDAGTTPDASVIAEAGNDANGSEPNGSEPNDGRSSTGGCSTISTSKTSGLGGIALLALVTAAARRRRRR